MRETAEHQLAAASHASKYRPLGWVHRLNYPSAYDAERPIESAREQTCAHDNWGATPILLDRLWNVRDAQYKLNSRMDGRCRLVQLLTISSWRGNHYSLLPSIMLPHLGLKMFSFCLDFRARKRRGVGCEMISSKSMQLRAEYAKKRVIKRLTAKAESSAWCRNAAQAQRAAHLAVCGSRAPSIPF